MGSESEDRGKVVIYLGYDPGGVENANGVALLKRAGTMTYETGCVSCVDEAMQWFTKRLGANMPAAAGIDSFLYWETGRCGWRGSDLWLKHKYGRNSKIGNSVVSSNSAQGSMAVQGMALAIRLRQRWPTLELTETHPKVLYFALKAERYGWKNDSSQMTAWLEEKIGGQRNYKISTDHEWDALISAWAAMKGHLREWPLDLRTAHAASANSNQMPLEPAGKVYYWWPDHG